MVYQILGIERFEGISKKTGKPYDFTRFYAVPSRHSDKVRGIRVENVDIWNGEYAPDISDIHPGITQGPGILLPFDCKKRLLPDGREPSCLDEPAEQRT